MAEPSPLETPADADGLTEDDGSAARSRFSSRGAAIGSARTRLSSSRRRATLAKAGSSTSGPGSARWGSRSRSARRLYPPTLSRSIPGWRNSRRGTRRATGFGRGADPAHRRARPWRAPQDRALRIRRLRRHQSSLLRGRDGSGFPRRGQSARACHARRAPARRSPTGFPPRSRSQAWRAFRDDPPSRGAWRDPGRHREPARGNCAPAGSSDTRRERASPARLGRERLEGAAAPCAGADPALGRRTPHGGSGRDPSRRAAIEWGG